MLKQHLLLFFMLIMLEINQQEDSIIFASEINFKSNLMMTTFVLIVLV